MHTVSLFTVWSVYPEHLFILEGKDIFAIPSFRHPDTRTQPFIKEIIPFPTLEPEERFEPCESLNFLL
jgi:hypothetical protein